MKFSSRYLLLVGMSGAALACGPRLRPLGGAPAPAVFPRSELPRGHQRLVFDWVLDDPELSARGEGAARTAWPDSARLDFFVAGGLAGGAAVLIGDELRLPRHGDDFARRLIPPAPLLWAALGRLVVPAVADTVARVDGDTVRADLGQPVVWRVTFVRDTLRRLERIENGRVREWVERVPPASTTGTARAATTSGASGRLRYRNELNRRQLDLTVTRVDAASAFDPFIWVFQ